jgi:chromosome segregation ATPase
MNSPSPRPKSPQKREPFPSKTYTETTLNVTAQLLEAADKLAILEHKLAETEADRQREHARVMQLEDSAAYYKGEAARLEAAAWDSDQKVQWELQAYEQKKKEMDEDLKWYEDKGQDARASERRKELEAQLREEQQRVMMLRNDKRRFEEQLEACREKLAELNGASESAETERDSQVSILQQYGNQVRDLKEAISRKNTLDQQLTSDRAELAFLGRVG